jgi:hypothetical protein
MSSDDDPRAASRQTRSPSHRPACCATATACSAPFEEAEDVAQECAAARLRSRDTYAATRLCFALADAHRHQRLSQRPDARAAPLPQVGIALRTRTPLAELDGRDVGDAGAGGRLFPDPARAAESASSRWRWGSSPLLRAAAEAARVSCC